MPEYGLRPDPGLPVPPYWAERLAAALPGRAEAEPPGGGERIRAAAAGYWGRRGLATRAEDIVAAPGGQPLLLALLAAVGGDVVYTQPGAAWHTAPARLLGRSPLSVPPPAEGGGAPDPFALLEVVLRDRREGGDPRALVMAGADDPTGTVTPPELLHEMCEAARDAGLVVVSDETFADTVHHHGGDGAGDAVLLSPAETLPGRTVVLTDLAAALAPPAWPVAVARFPGTEFGARLRTVVLRVCADLGAVLPGPVADAAAYVLGEPEEVRARVAAAARLHAAVAAAAHRVVTASGALCRPPEAGFQLYADLSPLGTGLAAPALERRLGLPGGHRFGDDPDAPRVRIRTAALYGTDAPRREAALSAPDPLALPHVTAALKTLSSTLTSLS